jgi:hypothetical protein
MKIFIITSKRFYDRIPPIESALLAAGHSIILPNTYDDPNAEFKQKEISDEKHASWKGEMFKTSAEKIRSVDAVLVLNFEKDGQPHYIGGATFIEMYEAFMNEKKIYMFEGVPSGILADEIRGFSPILIAGDLSKVR